VGIKLFKWLKPLGETCGLRLRTKIQRVSSALLLLPVALSLPGTAFAENRAPNRLLLKPKPRLSMVELDRRIGVVGARETRRIHRSDVRVLHVPEAQWASTLATLQRDPDIEFVEPDFVASAAYLPDDPRVQSGEAWHLARMQVTPAWDYTVGRPEIVVAVLDSGVNTANGDLVGRVLAGYDFVNRDADVTDDFGHGTAVCGTIVAAGNNGLGSAGVAFGCRVLPVKVMGATGYAYYSEVAEGIRYAVEQGARVINISIAGDSPSLTLQAAIDFAWSNNVIIVAAAGNTASSTPQYPAACAHVVAVAATDQGDMLAGFSSYGEAIRLTAPGVGIWTTQRQADNPFGAWRGTSFASPLVAGAAALLLSARPELSNAEAVAILEQTADDLGPAGRDQVFGFGRVNVLAALQSVGATPGVVLPPLVGPRIGLRGAAENQTFSLNEPIALAADVESAAGVGLVEFYANDQRLLGFTTSPYAFEWTPVQPGDYTLSAMVQDASGQRATSAPVTIHVTAMKATAPLPIRIMGEGAVSPTFAGRELEIGRTYTTRVRPGKDQLFAGWEGVDSASPTLTFVMREGLELTARFVPSPFVELKGSYSGLIADPDGVMPESSGAFTLTLTRLGGFSGRLQLAGHTHSFRGQFDLQGRAAVTVPRSLAATVQLELSLDLAAGGTHLSGRVSSGGWVSALNGNRNPFNSRFNPAPQTGSVSFVLADAAPAENPVATGASRISAAGKAAVKGRLLDGRKFARAASLSRQGDFPLYLALGGGQEVVIGWVNFSAQSTTAASGTVVWTRSGTNAFATTLQATGTR
jgi:subtilisin family serine protease